MKDSPYCFAVHGNWPAGSLDKHIGRFRLGVDMGVYEIDPLCDLRWPEFLQRNPRASVLHTHDWLEALKRTYGYEPVAYTTSAPGAELISAWLFCRVRSG